MSIEIRINTSPPAPPPPSRWVGQNVPTREISAVETNLSCVFQNVYKQISSLLKNFLQNFLNELTCRAAMVCPAGNGLWDSWFSVLLDMLCLSSIRCACPQCDVVVLDTLCLS